MGGAEGDRYITRDGDLRYCPAGHQGQRGKNGLNNSEKQARVERCTDCACSVCVCMCTVEMRETSHELNARVQERRVIFGCRNRPLKWMLLQVLERERGIDRFRDLMTGWKISCQLSARCRHRQCSRVRLAAGLLAADTGPRRRLRSVASG